MVFENYRKSLIQHCDASYVHILSGQKLIKNAKNVLFTALLNRGAANNLCYPPADCQQREIILLSPALEFYHSAVEFYHPAHGKITINWSIVLFTRNPKMASDLL